MTIEPVIRSAKREDVATVHKFLHAAAADQNLAGTVKATKDELLDTLDFNDNHDGAQGPFNRNPPGKVLLIIDSEGKIAGMAIFIFVYSSWTAKPGINLEDLFVLPQYRRQGYARRLMQAVAREAKASGCTRVDWLCYRDNHRAIRFYEGLGAREMGNLTPFRLEKEPMEALADE